MVHALGSLLRTPCCNHHKLQERYKHVCVLLQSSQTTTTRTTHKPILGKNIITTHPLLYLPILCQNIITTHSLLYLLILYQNIITTHSLLYLPILSSSSSSCCRSRSDKDCFHHLTVALHLSLCCESDVHESIFMSLSFRFLLMVSLNRRRGRPLFL